MKLRTLLLTAALALPATGHAMQDVYCEQLSVMMGNIYQMHHMGERTTDIKFYVRNQCMLRADICQSLMEVVDMANDQPITNWGVKHPGHFVEDKVYRQCIRSRLESGQYGSPAGMR